MRLALSEEDFERVRRLLANEAGLVFDDGRRDSLSYSLAERLDASGAGTVDAYLGLLAGTTGRDELQALLNEVTIQETHFFRNPPQFRALRMHVLPELIKTAIKAPEGERRLRVWSAGCSTGEEPYSVAMLLRELLPLQTGWNIKVIATDISTRALAAAKVGRYGARSLGAADPADVERWFVRDGEDYVVRPEVRELVEFRHHNLVADPPPFEPGEQIDLVLCRNVTIYFSRETTRGLMTRLHDTIVDGGYLFLGHSETLWQVNDQFRLVTLGDAFVYRRDDRTPSSPDGEPAERRTVLPDRRTGDDGLTDGERRVRERRSGTWQALTKPRALPFQRVARERAPETPAPAPSVVSADPMSAVHEALATARYEDAVQQAAAIAEAEPLRADAHYLRGLALANLGRDAEALVELRKAIYVDPSAGFAHFLLAGTLGRLGDHRGASKSYRAAADTLGRSAADRIAAELGGRNVQELVDLCRQLAGVGDNGRQP